MKNFRFYVDRAPITYIPSAIVDYFKDNGLLMPGQEKIHFVGIVYLNNIINIFVPRNTHIQNLNSKEAINQGSISRSLLLSLNKYFNSSTRMITDVLDEEGTIGESSLALILALLDDFILNGLFKKYRTENARNRSKINWKKTINSCPAYLDKNVPYYLEWIGTQKIVDTNNSITKIHAEIIKELFESFGWLISFDRHNIEQTLLNIPLSQHNIEEKILIIDEALRKTYFDRDIYLLNLLKQYLMEQANNRKGNMVIGVKEFHNIWEEMLSACLDFKKSINHKLLAPVYNISGNYIMASSKGQRTDIVLEKNGDFIIIDAKYYAATNINNSPSLQDIIKQFYYAKALSIIEKEAKSIKNIFIFPGQSGPIKKIHMSSKQKNHNISIKEFLDEEFPPILCLYQDPLELIEYYSSGRKIHSYQEYFFGNEQNHEKNF